jgi:3-oxoacyl-[acyl-carrier-protein] synthase-1
LLSAVFMKNDVVVTGLGFITSIGNSRRAVLDSLWHLRSGIEAYGPFAPENIPVKLAGTIKEFDVESLDQEDWSYPKEYRIPLNYLRGLSPHGLYGHCALAQALAEAGLTKEDVSNHRTGLYTASAGSSTFIANHLFRLHKYGVERTNPKGMVASIAGTLNFNLVAAFGIRGSSCGFVSACASSGHALAFAAEEIVSGRQDRMLVVGAEDGNIDTILPFASMRALSLNTDPLQASRPFDKNRDGFVGTGGGIAMVLESRELAESRSADIKADFIGWGQASDGFNSVLPEPEGAGLHQAMTLATERAGIQPDDLDYINAHAPSTFHGDQAECRALRRFLKPGGKTVISSTKAITGHGLSSASILEAALSIVAMEEGFTPGSAHVTELDPETEGLNILLQSEKRNPRLIASNSSGFGGANVCLIFRKP